ncbi:ABC transporter permease [Proteiniborus sp. MB09-C3]|uniref:FtsX-like permease family protein n=1 Tax=Proteiniborus sp. MB09-C3 TaxID=3050072 RepID=UPI00255471CD|nr:ABC transporter permease [Proteiniborus sp. MB09-C3]WIV12703.1 ABC transporter permease [Proteiniborus sp. MB09-C3]
MTLRDIAYKNIKGNFNRYVMYYLSNTLVVMVFFIFANFIFNPTVSNVKTLGTKGVLAANTMIVCEVLILVFTFLFTFYSISNFLKSREKEFGLLSMFGLTKAEIRRYVVYENLFVSLISIISGLLIGILFSKLFLMGITVIMVLDVEVPFLISVKAVVITALSFIALFQGISFIVTFRIKNNNIVELLKGARVAQPTPKFSVIKTVLAILFIVIGYGLAVISGGMIILTMFPVLFFTVTGTYFLFSQFSVFVTSKLKKNKKVFYNGTSMITLSQIIYKLKDNAKVLFIVSILGAITLTASASVYSVQQSIKAKVQLSYPHDISFMEIGIGQNDMSILQKAEYILEKNGNELSNKNQVVLLKAKNQDKPVDDDKDKNPYRNPNREDFYVMSNSDYNLLAEQFKKEKVTLTEGKVYVNSYEFVIMGAKDEKLFTGNEFLTLAINGEPNKFKLVGEAIGGVIDVDRSKTNVAVVSDVDFERFKANTPKEKQIMYYGYNIKDWKKSANAVREMYSIVPQNENILFAEKITDFAEIMQTTSLFLFIGTFISILFFIATGSIIYFKMFNEIQKDRQEFISLKKMGMTDGETKKIVSTQTFIVFFLPFIVTFSHAAFAIIALSNLLSDNITMYFLTIAAIYLVFQAFYYVFAKTMYTKQIKNLGV